MRSRIPVVVLTLVAVAVAGCGKASPTYDPSPFVLQDPTTIKAKAVGRSKGGTVTVTFNSSETKVAAYLVAEPDQDKLVDQLSDRENQKVTVQPVATKEHVQEGTLSGTIPEGKEVWLVIQNRGNKATKITWTYAE
jgi:hypothetical protein